MLLYNADGHVHSIFNPGGRAYAMCYTEDHVSTNSYLKWTQSDPMAGWAAAQAH